MTNAINQLSIESFFEAEKQHADGSRARVWYADTLRGRMFVQFVSLCYYEYLSEELRRIKRNLGVPTGDTEHDNDNNIKNELKLKSWMNNTPLYLQLQWFDTIESVTTDSIASLCQALHCQPGDILEYVPETNQIMED